MVIGQAGETILLEVTLQGEAGHLKEVHHGASVRA